MLPDTFWHDVGPTLGAVIAVLMFVIVPIFTAAMSALAVRRASTARDAASRAAVLSEPTGNGFASKVRGDLDLVKSKLSAIELDMHQARRDHRSDLNEVRRALAGIRSDVGDVGDQASENRRRIRTLWERIPHTRRLIVDDKSADEGDEGE